MDAEESKKRNYKFPIGFGKSQTQQLQIGQMEHLVIITQVFRMEYEILHFKLIIIPCFWFTLYHMVLFSMKERIRKR